MAEPEPHLEGWAVPQATPAIAALATLGLLVVLLLVAGWFYRQRLQPKRQQPVTSFPAPGVETFIHDGTADPPRPRPASAPDPAIEVAKRAVVTEGLPGWEARR